MQTFFFHPKHNLKFLKGECNKIDEVGVKKNSKNGGWTQLMQL